MGKAEWIWYPGDFEVMLLNRTMTKRFEQDVMIPPFWRTDSFYFNVKFRAKVSLSKPAEIEIYARGKVNIIVNPRGTFREHYLKKFNGVLALDPGKYDLQITVYNEKELPCIFVRSEEFCSDRHFEVSCNDGKWLPAATASFFEPSVSPNEFSLGETRVNWATRKKLPEGILYVFPKAVVCRLHFPKVKKAGRIIVVYGESLEEAQDERQAEQIDEFTVTEDAWTSISKIFRYVFIKSEDAVFDDPEFWFEDMGRQCLSLFESEDALLNRIYKTALYTFRLNSREFFLDGVKRDRWVWSGDATQSYLMDFYSFFNLDCTRRTMSGLGGKSPVTMFINHIMDYTLYWILSFRDYYDYTGDLAFVAENFDRMLEHLAFVRTRLNPEGFLEGLSQDWVFVDWANLDNTGAVCVEQMLYCEVLKTIGYFAKKLGRRDSYTRTSVKLRRQIQERFWDSDRGCYIHSLKNGCADGVVTRHANFFAVRLGFCDEARKNSILQNVLFNKEVPKILTPYMRFYELSTLCDLGQWKFVLDEIKDYWGGMLAEGATTFWEQYDASQTGAEKYAMYGRAFGKSLCHAWGASPLYLIGRYFAGLRPHRAAEQYILEPVTDLCFRAEFPIMGGSIRLAVEENGVRVFCAEKDGFLFLPTHSFSGKSSVIQNGKYKIRLRAGREYRFERRKEK